MATPRPRDIYRGEPLLSYGGQRPQDVLSRKRWPDGTVSVVMRGGEVLHYDPARYRTVEEGKTKAD